MSSSTAFKPVFLRPAPVAKFDSSADVLTAIYDDDCHLAVWQDAMPTALSTQIQQHIAQGRELQVETITDLDSLSVVLHRPLAHFGAQPALFDHIFNLVDMFGCLFETNKVGLRIATLTAPMCPRFHSDKIVCRLVTTLCGPATQWLAADSGYTNQDFAGSTPRVLVPEQAIKQLNTGDVALLKGSAWPGFEDFPLLHRSPPQIDASKRIVLTLDAI